MWVAREIVSQQKGRTSSVWSANRIIYIQHVCPSCKDFWLNRFHIRQLHKIVNVSFDVKFHFDAKMGDAKVTSNHTNVALIVGNIFLLVFATSKSNANILPTRLDLLCLLCTRSVQIQAFRVGVWHVFQSIWHWNSPNTPEQVISSRFLENQQPGFGDPCSIEVSFIVASYYLFISFSSFLNCFI